MAALSLSNPLMSGQRTSDLRAVLHPLVVLNISDYITRHTLRKQPGPVVGGLIGQQNGREITVEHAFDAKTTSDDAVDGGWLLDQTWFSSRVEQSESFGVSSKLRFCVQEYFQID